MRRLIMPKVLELPDMNINNEELRLLLAIKLFEEKKVSLGKASEIAGYTEKAFSEILLKRRISPVRYEDIDLKKEIRNA
jgi:predicted HTH domain antitoxin